jgi:hypothetical protein
MTPPARLAPLHTGYPSTSDDWVADEARGAQRAAQPSPRYVDRYGIEVVLGDVVER